GTAGRRLADRAARWHHGAAGLRRIHEAQRAAVRAPAAGKARRTVWRARRRRALGRADADRRHRHARDWQPRCEPVPPGHGHGVPQADRRSGRGGGRPFPGDGRTVSADALAAPVERYLDHLRVERRYAPGTIVNYRRALAGLLTYAGKLSLRHW